jgi:hypothetical protein
MFNSFLTDPDCASAQDQNQVPVEDQQLLPFFTLEYYEYMSLSAFYTWLIHKMINVMEDSKTSHFHVLYEAQQKMYYRRDDNT